ncbi:MAG TPA: phosphoribosylamine--glycine ligase, partial [Planctomycetota bacterium]|nr:phosphoribosylamine--glycine ligase [Planctomycetota bacterium]
MKVLVVGSGGREHALCTALARSPSVERVYVAPGNDGMAGVATCVSDLLTTHTQGLVAFAQSMGVGLVVVGPEAPLVAGLADAVRKAGIPCFGPGLEGAQIEGSKAWAKSLMVRNNIPTAGHHVFASASEARAYLAECESWPLVVKADGLAGGKGVAVCYARQEAFAAVADSMDAKKFGDAGARIVIEEFLRGEEVSVHAITDGDTLLLCPSAQDHKRLKDGDQGPNTGGMGAYSPAPVLTDKILDVVVRTILVPVLHALKREGIEYRGVLYAGLMLTRGGPRVLEWNCRFGDPETQVILPRLTGDLGAVLLAAANGKLDAVEALEVDPRPVVGVVMASEGYPEAYKAGRPILGLDEAGRMEDVTVYHASTRRKDGALLTAGGRVLTVTALGRDFADARDRAYKGVGAISWEGEQHRTDIARRALEP